jgi:glycine/D-amino acid oxidase-like deaminating enzyme
VSENRKDLAIVGAGILGLAHAYAAAKAGKRVVVLERSQQASGASVRNFGMVWPIGQPAGEMLALSMRSRAIWQELLHEAKLPLRETGSLHLVYRADEAAVAEEFAELAPGLGYDCQWLSAQEVLRRSSAVQPDGLLGGLWSATEFTIDPRQILAA